MSEELIKKPSLAETVKHLVTRHIASSGKEVVDLHQLVIEQIEPPLFKAVMEQYQYNQRRSAKALGMSRSTFRKLLINYFGDQYCGRRLNPIRWS